MVASCNIKLNNSLVRDFVKFVASIEQELNEFRLAIKANSPKLPESSAVELMATGEGDATCPDGNNCAVEPGLLTCHIDNFAQYAKPSTSVAEWVLSRIASIVKDEGELTQFFKRMEKKVLDLGNVNLKITDPDIICFYSTYDSLVGELGCIQSFIKSDL